VQPYQYQIDDIVFGRNTIMPISKVEIQSYNVQNQDFQIEQADETSFGIDTLVAAPIVFTMAMQENYILPQYEHLYPNGLEPDDLFALRGTLLGKLARSWKAKPIRMSWGTVMPLLCCTSDGEVLRIYGRPGKFQYSPRYNDKTQWIDIMGEFRRADTFAHSNTEYYVGDDNSSNGMAPGAPSVTAVRGLGDGDAWVRALIQGPATNPVITYGNHAIETNSVIPAGVIAEISSYPWQRRYVDTNNVNRRTEIIGETLYLDQIQFPEGAELEVSWTASGTTADSMMWFMWREAYNVI
jgi:hypothetical protein